MWSLKSAPEMGARTKKASAWIKDIIKDLSIRRVGTQRGCRMRNFARIASHWEVAS